MGIDKYFRSFTFYNDRSNNFKHKLEDNKDKKKFFRTLGYFDEFRTERIDFAETNGDMDFLWKKINNMNENLIGIDKSDFYDASFQNIFGVPCNYLLPEDSHEIEDEKFWNEEGYAFTFVILVQFFSKDDSNISLEQKIKSYKREFCKQIDENLLKYKTKFLVGKESIHPVEKYLDGDKLKANYIITDYITFDRYDYILSVKSNCYLPIVLAMQQLYSLYSYETKVPIALNSFTVTAIGQEGQLINEIIPSICIKFNYDENNIFLYNLDTAIESSFNVFSYLRYFNRQKLYSVLYPMESYNENKHRLYYISGEDDVRIIAREVEMKNLFNIFKEESALCDEYLYGFSTAINVLYDCGNEEKYEHGSKEGGNNLNNKEIEDEIRYCKELIGGLNDRYPSELTKTLIQINSGLSAIRPLNTFYRGYGFYSLFIEFKSFIELLHDFQGTPSKAIITKSFQVTHSFGSALLTTVRSDFREFQIPTFNANLYYAPTKMLVFYRAFITKLIKWYSCFNKGSAEHFIINTGNEITTRVLEMLPITKNDGSIEKFFVCNMSERNIYMITNSMIQLNHEVAHFGLKSIRNRKDRLKYMADCYFIAYIVAFKFYFTNAISNCTELDDKEIKRCLHYINDDAFNSLFLKSLRISFFNSFKFTDNKQYYMEETINEINYALRKNENQFFEVISKNCLDHFCFETQNDIQTIFRQYDALERKIKKSFIVTNQLLLSESNTNKIDSFDYFITLFLKECFADIIAVLTLNLFPNDYFETLLKVSNNAGINNVNQKIVLQYRFFIVFNAINSVINNSNEKLFHENEFLLEWSLEKCLNKYIKGSVMYNATKGYQKYINDLQVDLLNSWLDKKTNAFLKKLFEAYNNYDLNATLIFKVFYYDKTIFKNIVSYLVGCIKSYLKNYDEIIDKETNFSPNKIYKKISCGNTKIEDKIVYIDDLLTDFENECYNKLKNKEIK